MGVPAARSETPVTTARDDPSGRETPTEAPGKADAVRHSSRYAWIVTLPEGAYRWDATANVLNPVAVEDLRGATGTQPFPAAAPLNLVYVADMSKLTRPSTDPQQMLNVGADAGFIAENVYLFCASEGLATVVRASVAKDVLAKSLKLKDTQVIVLAQTVGYPKK